ncbi:DUF5082 domain-containing protein [Metabacillus sp. GX 13764]|nr:DUF5082 family protein [Metabacillus kandeliae]MCD7035550.1 DUF5082 domain-containing protein [Metabacillus kandeliae]
MKMDVTNLLSAVNSTISNKSAALDEEIARLERAKSKIAAEQNAGLGEINKIMQPELGKLWTGKRAESFQQNREDAYQAMQEVFNSQYDSYLSSIGNKIFFLKAEKAAADAASALCSGYRQAVEAGKDLADDVYDKLKGWL